MTTPNPLSRQHVPRINGRYAWICFLPPIGPAAGILAGTGLTDRALSVFVGDLSSVRP